MYWTQSEHFVDTNWAGSGTESDPWLITSNAELAGLSFVLLHDTMSAYLTDSNGSNTATSGRNLYFGGKHFKQTCDIDVSEYWWQPIGLAYYRSGDNVQRYFAGNYNGNGYTVSGVFTKQGSTNAYSYQGLFGYVQGISTVASAPEGYAGASIKNLTIDNSYIQGYNYVGGIAGCAQTTVIQNCKNKARVYATGNYAGGIAGVAQYSSPSEVAYCCNYGDIRGGEYVAGIAGNANSGAKLHDCYNSGLVVAAKSAAGGITNGAFVANTFYNLINTGKVSAMQNSGGIIGYISSSFNGIKNCINVGEVIGASVVGEIIGGCANKYNGDSYLEQDSVAFCYYLNRAIGVEYSYEYTLFKMGKNQAKNQVFYTKSSNWNSSYVWDFDNVWKINGKNNCFPVLKWEEDPTNWIECYDLDWEGNGADDNPYIIDTPYKLAGLAYSVNVENIDYEDEYFLQTANFDLGGYEWTPIGTGDHTDFNGHYDGGNYVISGMFINRPNDTWIGLFGSVGYTSLENIILKNSTIIGSGNVGSIVGISDAYVNNCHSNTIVKGVGNVGGLVGYNWRGKIVNSSFSGSVTGTGECFGGIVGRTYGSITDSVVNNCINKGNVKGKNYVGGIAGYFGGSTMIDCTSTGSVEATNIEVGGLVGRATEQSKIENNFASLNVMGIDKVGGLVGYSESDTILTKCIFDGVVEGSDNVGGLIGEALNTFISYCMGTGQIVFNGGVGANVGAIVGKLTGHYVIYSNFVGNSNVKIVKFTGIQTAGSMIGGCYFYINNQGYYSDSDLSAFKIVEGMNNNLPILEDLFWQAEFGEEVTQEWLDSKGFKQSQ